MDCQWLIISVDGRFLPLIHSSVALKWHRKIFLKTIKKDNDDEKK